MLQRTLIFVSALTMLSGCGLLGASGPPTPYPAEYITTAVHLTAVSIDAATQTAKPPTITPSLTTTLLPPTVAPSETPTPGPRVPLAAIQVRSPGPMSRIVSPLQVQLLAIAGASKRVEIALFGEDGRLLGRTLVAVPGSAAGDAVSVKIPFEIRAAGENGYVQVSTKNGRSRLQSLVTVPVLLLSSGVSQVNPPGNTVYERVALANLEPEAEIAAASLVVVGQILPYNSNPVIMELIAEDGENLSLRVLNVTGTQWQAVSTTLPFRVNSARQARLFIHQAHNVLDGDAYIFSQLLTLEP